MELAELRFHLIEHGLPALAADDVVLHGVYTGVVGFEERQRGLQALFVAIADDDFHAGVRRCARDAETDAVGRGGDVGDFAFQVLQRRRLRNGRLSRQRGGSRGGRRCVLRPRVAREPKSGE
jgi:hypothetical protein